MKTHIANRGLYFFIAAFSFLALSACDTNNTDDDAPEVIPSAVFTLPVDLFDQTAGKAEQPGVNFTAAALRVWPVSLIITANLIIPSVTTLQALEADPIFQDDNWQWTSTALANGETIQFTLSANRNGGSTSWSMNISTGDTLSGETLQDFQLFTAQTSQNGQVGSWQLFYQIDGAPQNVLNADYTYTSDTEKAITFSIPESAAQGAGDSVEYTENGDIRTFMWQQVADSLTHTIDWNVLTSEGSITATNFNSGTKSCWDASLEDAVCAPS